MFRVWHKTLFKTTIDKSRVICYLLNMNKTTYILAQRLAGTPQEYWTLRIMQEGRAEDQIHTGARAYVTSRIPAGAVRVEKK